MLPGGLLERSEGLEEPPRRSPEAFGKSLGAAGGCSFCTSKFHITPCECDYTFARAIGSNSKQNQEPATPRTDVATHPCGLKT